MSEQNMKVFERCGGGEAQQRLIADFKKYYADMPYKGASEEAIFHDWMYLRLTEIYASAHKKHCLKHQEFFEGCMACSAANDLSPAPDAAGERPARKCGRLLETEGYQEFYCENDTPCPKHDEQPPARVGAERELLKRAIPLLKCSKPGTCYGDKRIGEVCEPCELRAALAALEGR